ncbi:GerW family sporulation protein [Paludifilum halophilum]|uniref:Sporulation protein YtfJ n=1 Tax=Paludifilum halophilum TaxID=1642702 RepID=A0A235BBS8_9BACL|nr:GerW family sporulation protein [Paludifilum halophilum]OYD09761.1 sporulation protein YtfJ [Paludifilum halophilum]
MAEHPIQGLMTTAMENIKEMVDVNTIIGEPVESPDGSVILPISRVGFGFAAGGSEFSGQKDSGSERDRCGSKDDEEGGKMPFGGGSGAGVSVTPVGFLVVSEKGIRMLNVEGSQNLYDRILDLAPGLIEKLQKMAEPKKKERFSEPKTDI